MSNKNKPSNIDYLANCALAGADGDISVAMAAIREAARTLAKWKLEAIIRADNHDKPIGRTEGAGRWKSGSAGDG